MPVIQPALGTVTLIYIYIKYMIIVGKSIPIDNYEKYKSNKSNHQETIHACETERETHTQTAV